MALIRTSTVMVISFLLLVSGVSATAVQVANVRVSAPGTTSPVNIILDTSSTGIAGYDLTITMSNSSIGEITGVSFPSWAVLNESSPLPSSSVRIRAVDLSEKIGPGGTNIPLGTITVRGKTAGSTDLTVSVENLTGDQGDIVPAITVSGKFTVDQAPARISPVIVNHTSTHLGQIPLTAISNAKTNLHIAYGHTSHGSQIITGMDGLTTFAGAPYGGSTYSWNNGGSGGSLDLRDTPFSGASDLGNPDYSAWATATRNYLDAHPEVNVIMWSWCGEADTTPENIDTYLSLMNQLETDYPEVKFVYMTGHLVGSGEEGNLNQRNGQIRAYVTKNNKILYDFADIESFDPDELVNYMKLDANDNCDYVLNGNSHNWATEWQDQHTEGIDWFDCSPAHTQALNGNQKAFAAWWLWARLAGWEGTGATTSLPDSVGVYRPSAHQFLLRPGNWPASPAAVINWGVGTDLPVTGDWNGDTLNDVGVFRPSTHSFYLKNGTMTTTVNWGVGTDLPVTGDWNGDTLNDVGVFRPSTHSFYLKNGTVTTTVNWGVGTDLPVTGDWDGNGKTEVGVYRPSAHSFLLRPGNWPASPAAVINWGVATDLPVTGDWDGNGATDIGIFRPSTHMFYLKNGTMTTGINWGLGSDKPLAGSW